jgi:agmatine deiminase
MKSWDISSDPRDLGYFMPGEWTDHDCCWMAWPCRNGIWSNNKETMQEYANVAHAIARFEPVKMLVPPERIDSAIKLLNQNIEILEIEIDDSWARDSGPNFLIGGDNLAGSDWIFNAWGEKYHPYDQDAQMAKRILKSAYADIFPSWLVAEGGGITVDGEGTIITTESCLLNKNRNPIRNRLEIENELCRTLGGSKVIWLPGDIDETETDGHIDGIAAFIEPGRILIEVNSDKSDPHYKVGIDNTNALKNKTDAKGRKLQIEFIEEGIYHKDIWNGGCSSYINSYLANNAVIVPAYGYDRDHLALETYTGLYPNREIIQVPIHNIATGGGGIHCITQQQPKYE